MPRPRRVYRQPRPPRILAREAKRAGLAPEDFLAGLISQHPTFEAAAKAVGVSRETFRMWRRRYPMRVVAA